MGFFIPGGASSPWLLPEHLDEPLDMDRASELGTMLGSGAIMVFDETVDPVLVAWRIAKFFAHESCGKCTPCRIGSVRGAEALDRIGRGQDREANLALVEELCDTMLQASLCGLGGMAPYPVLSALKHFPEDFRRRGAGH